MVRKITEEQREAAQRDRRLLATLIEKGTGLEAISVMTGYPVKLIVEVVGEKDARRDE
jgi:hypothetical protein